MDERPPCPFCGKNSLISNGSARWTCKSCGKHPQKIYNPRPPKIIPEFDNSDLDRYYDFPKLYGNWLLIGDIHCPFHCPETSTYAIELARKWGIRKVVSVGDTFELESFKKYLDSHPQVNWKYEKAAGVKFLSALLESFDEIQLLIGNHELRYWKKAEAAGDQEDIFQFFVKDPRIKISIYPFCTVNDSWLLVHPQSYSRIQARNPYFLASKHLIGLIEDGKSPNGQYGLVAYHGHGGGEGTDISSRFQVADGMGLFDPDLFNYYVKKVNTAPKWRKGFMILRNNYLYRFPLQTTDWDYWLPEDEKAKSRPSKIKRMGLHPGR